MLPSPNEPTEGPGGVAVYDPNGLYVGVTRTRDEPDAPSEDLARVVIHLSHEARDRLGVKADATDVEATWLVPEKDHLVLDRPLLQALREQGFDL